MNIRNLVRSKSLYSEGMLPRIFHGSSTVGSSSHQSKDYKKNWYHDPIVTQEVKFFPTDTSQNFDPEFLQQ